MAQKTNANNVYFIPIDQYLESRLSKKFQKKLDDHKEKALGHDIYEFNKNKYLTIFSNDRFETMPITYINGVDGIHAVRHKYRDAKGMAFIDIISSYTIIEDNPKGIIISSVSVPFYGRNFTIKEAKTIILSSGINIKLNNITSERILADHLNATSPFEEVSFKNSNFSINLNVDAENNLATVWTKIINYKQILESNIDPFRDSTNNGSNNLRIMEMLPLDYSILQLENANRIAGFLRRYNQI